MIKNIDSYETNANIGIDTKRVVCACLYIYLTVVPFHFQAHDDAKKGYDVRAKNKARIAYMIIGAAILIDILLVVIVVVVIKT